MLTDQKKQTSNDFNLTWKYVIRVILESLIGILVISYMKPDVPFNSEDIIKNTLILSTIFIILDWYDDDLSDRARGGLFYSVGTCFY